VSHRNSTQAWALTRHNSLTVTIRLRTGGRRHGRTRPGAVETRIGATSISRHFCYWLIFDSDILRQEAPSVDEHHYGEWKERGALPNMPASRGRSVTLYAFVLLFVYTNDEGKVITRRSPSGIFLFVQRISFSKQCLKPPLSVASLSRYGSARRS
jgi:hypothetical protein